MKTALSVAPILALAILAGCSGATPVSQALPQSASALSSAGANERAASGGLTELYNLDYSNGSITVYSIKNGKATQTAEFTPGNGLAQGLAADAHRHIYSTVSYCSSPCGAYVQVFTDTGKVIRQLNAPTLQGAPGPPSLTDVSVDTHDNVYVSDYGQQAVYFFQHGRSTKHGPIVVVQNSHNAASVLSQPDGKVVLISGGCGFASVAPFTRVSHGKYTQGACFGIATIALIGGAVDDQEEVMTPVDGVFGLVSVSSPTGGTSFQTPDRMASVSGTAFNSDASIAYVANARKECVYAFARPANGWLSGVQPKVLATYKGFKNLDIIAVPQ